MTRSDEQIVESVRGGDTEAFRHLVERHQNTVYGMLLRLVNDPDSAEELAQETFVRAYRSLSGFRGEARFSTWLVQIALHAARDRQRSKERTKIISLNELEERRGHEAKLEETRSAFDPLAELSESEFNARLQKGLESLPADYREVFVLRHLEELGYEQIAALTKSSVGSLKVRSHRARKLLREFLRERPTPRSLRAKRS